MSQITTKAGNYGPALARPRVAKEFNASTTSQPLDPTAAAKLSAALSAIGCDTGEIELALAGGTPNQQTDAFIAVLNKLLWTAGPGAADQPAPTKLPAKLRSRDYAPPLPVAAKASQDPYANLTRGLFRNR
jgi:hypothetical protein